MRPITATIITLDEADDIAACIESARRVCDEVVVVDSHSRDGTPEKARQLGARVIEQEYLGDGPQKDLGVAHARNDWILSLDADERLEEDAVAAIEKLALGASGPDAYALRRRNFVGAHWIRAAGFYPDYVVRLYDRRRARYSSAKAHARVLARSVVRLRAHIRHYTYRDYSHWLERINALSSRDAWALYERGRQPSRAAPALHAAGAALRKLVLKGGLVQGADGITVALTTTLFTFMKYQKLNELHERADSGRSRRDRF